MAGELKRVRFALQPTPSFPDGAPARESYRSDGDHENACLLYVAEWRRRFVCTSSHKSPDCPTHGCWPSTPPPIDTEAGGTEHDFDVCPLPPDRCEPCRVEFRRRRSTQQPPEREEGR